MISREFEMELFDSMPQSYRDLANEYGAVFYIYDNFSKNIPASKTKIELEAIKQLEQHMQLNRMKIKR